VIFTIRHRTYDPDHLARGFGPSAAFAQTSEPAENAVAPPGGSPLSPEPAKASSFELRLGTYWLVRIGIVMLLTGLAWLGYCAYENFIIKTGPVGKLTMLYAVSGVLLGAGAWLQRKQETESVKNYAQVLLAGGLAAVYFTTYAAHYVTALKVIQSAVLDGVLLLGWAACVVWLADRKRSEVLALFAIGLAYYTAAITNVGLFTLYSNLVLTVASVFFLVRNRWTTLSYGSLMATYAGFAFRRFYNNGAWLWDARTEAELWKANGFLGGYWTAFTAAAFLSRADKLSFGSRATFASLNNGAFFGLVIVSVLHFNHGHFWLFSLLYGAILIALAAAARVALREEAAFRNAYLTPGLVLVTVGFIAKLTGTTLALVLAAESVILLVLGEQQKNFTMRIGSYLTAAMALGWGAWNLKPFDRAGLGWGAALGGLLTFNSWWARRHDEKRDEPTLRPEATFFALLALLIWLATTWRNSTPDWRPPILALEAGLLTASIYWLGIREISLLGQSYLVLAQILWLASAQSGPSSPPWWSPAMVIVTTLGVSHWWQRQKALEASAGFANLLQGTYTLAIATVAFFWLHPHFQPQSWLALTSVLAVAVTVYGLVTRLWFLAGCGQLFLCVSAFEFARQLLTGRPAWYCAVAPVVTAFATAYAVTGWFAHRPGTEERISQPILQVSLVYRWVALIMSLWWIFKYVPPREQFWVLSLLSALVFLLAGWRRDQEGLRFAGVLFAVAFGVFATLPTRNAASVYWIDLPAILLMPALQQLARRRADHFQFEPKLHAVLMTGGAVLLWLYLTRRVRPQLDGLYLAVGWSVVAAVLFGAGSGLRERTYHLLGLAVLATALGRVVLHDVWEGSIYWPNLLPIFMVLSLPQLAKRVWAENRLEEPWHTGLILVGGLSLWFFLSRWVVLQSGETFLLTASWALFALLTFGTGFALHERIYRWLGLGILACALGRMMIIDVWKLPTLYRILSFMALGLVLLVLGFIYNKYQEKIREWL
jgi:uncharacterized membrane protein